ncbi:MAG: PTS sugar transporter subunit IIA [Calditrichaceae bacterium]
MSGKHLSCIITHGDLSRELKNVADGLVGKIENEFFFSNKTKSLESIESEIEQKIEEIKPEKLIFFIDLVGGSCWVLANRIKKSRPEAVVVGGVNVPMLVSYHSNHERMDWEQLIAKIMEDGKKGILIR